MKIILSLTLGCLLFACANSRRNIEYVDLSQIEVLSISADTVRIFELQNPSSLYAFKEWILFPHSEKTADAPFYLYWKKDLSFDFKWGKFGRGPNEIYDCNPYFFEKTDTSFKLNTNYIYETEFLINGDSLKMKSPQMIAPLSMNNLLRINDSIFFFENKLKEQEFSLYNVKDHAVVKNFGEYPSVVISFDELSDRDNICQKSCVLNREKGLIYVFYENLPLIRLYSVGGELLKEVALKGVNPKKMTTNEFYDSKSNLYFSFPYRCDNSIYVQFYNMPLSGIHELKQVEIQEWDEELNLKNRFLINRNFNIFCVAKEDRPVLYGYYQQEEDAYFVRAKLKN